MSQFGSDGQRVGCHEDMTERAISYVRYILSFKGIDTNTVFYGELRDVWLNIKPGEPVPQLTLDECFSDYSVYDSSVSDSYDDLNSNRDRLDGLLC